MWISKHTSQEMRSLTFLAATMVVYIHMQRYSALSSDTPEAHMKVLRFLTMMLSEGLCRIAVPMLFVFSGLFLFMKTDYLRGGYLGSIQKRFVTLLLPYVSWNILNLCILCAMENIELFRNISDKQMISDMSVSEILIGLLMGQFCGQLWYIRTLFILVVLSPLLYVFVKRMPKLTLIVFGCIWLFGLHPYADIHIAGGVFFFSLGAAVAVHKYNIEAFRPNSILVIVLVILLVVRAVIVLYHGLNMRVLHNLAILVGIYTLWIYRGPVCSKLRILYRFSAYSFFVYAFHQPLESFAFKLIMRFAKNTEALRVSLYLILPLTVIGIVLFIGMTLNALFPRVSFVLSGGRHPRLRDRCGAQPTTV